MNENAVLSKIGPPLQNKRGIEKAPFQLPHFIADTGVMEMRQALQVRAPPPPSAVAYLGFITTPSHFSW
jgi:hypothetical protein